MKYYFVSYAFSNAVGSALVCALVSWENPLVLSDLAAELQKNTPGAKEIAITNFFEVSKEMFLANTKPTQS